MYGNRLWDAKQSACLRCTHHGKTDPTNEQIPRRLRSTLERIICLVSVLFNGIHVLRETKTGGEDLNVAVMQDLNGREEITGQTLIPMGKLRDQQRHEEWFDLFDKSGVGTRGRVKLSLQWIHSRVKYLVDVVAKWDEHIKMQDEDRVEYERDLQVLYEAFPFLRQTQVFQKFQEGPQVRISHDLAISGYQNSVEYDAKPGLDMAEVPIIMGPAQRLANLATYICLFGGLVLCLFRPDFPTLIIPIFYFLGFYLRRLNSKGLKVVMAVVALSFVIDLLWIVAHSSVRASEVLAYVIVELVEGGK
jgi:hypothetical protein